MSEPQQVAPTLELISPVLPGRLYELNRDLVRIGRDPGSDIGLNRKDVSWLHAWVFRRPEGFFVEDRESRNGTYLDGAKLAPKIPSKLRDGARIKICDNLLIFRRQAVKVDDRDGGSTILGTLANLTSLDVVSSVARPEDVLRAVLEINHNLAGTIELNEALGKTLDTLFAVFPVKLIGHPEVMRLAVQRGLGHPALMKLTMTMLSNLRDPRGGAVTDRIVNTLARLAPAA